MARQRIPVSEAALLSRTNARIYCGCLGNERFDREVGPHVAPRLIGGERFYRRDQLNKWIGLDDASPDPYVSPQDFIDRQMSKAG